MTTKNVYLVPGCDPHQVAKLGWDRDVESYWFIVYAKGPFGEVNVDDTEIFFTIGVGGAVRQITNVGDLLRLTWGEIDWETPEGVYAMRSLRDDPIFEAAWFSEDMYGYAVDERLDDFLIYTFDSQAITKANDALRGHPEPFPKVPAPLTNKPTKPVPTTETRMPEGHRRFFRRRKNPIS